MAYELVPLENGSTQIPQQYYFTVYDYVVSGQARRFRVTSLENLDVYAKSRGLTSKDAVQHAYTSGWLDLATSTAWFKLLDSQSKTENKELTTQFQSLFNLNMAELITLAAIGLLTLSQLRNKST